MSGRTHDNIRGPWLQQVTGGRAFDCEILDAIRHRNIKALNQKQTGTVDRGIQVRNHRQDVEYASKKSYLDCQSGGWNLNSGTVRGCFNEVRLIKCRLGAFL